jgi:hypothetical protein
LAGAGTTVNLFSLRRAAAQVATVDVQLLAIDEAVLVPTAGGFVTLPLLEFGPPATKSLPVMQPDRHSDLPLFNPGGWARD